MSDLSGPQRVAVFLMSLGEDAAASILQHIDSKEVQQVSQAMSDLKKISWEQVDEVIDQFNEEVKNETAFGIKAPDFTRKMLTSSLGEKQAQAMMDRIGTPQARPSLESLHWMDPRELTELVKNENPQVIATVLALLDADASGALLERLDESLAQNVLMRLARISEIPPAAIAELEELLNTRGISEDSGDSGAPIQLKGTGQAADVVNAIPAELEEKLMDAMREEDPDLAQQVEDLMFVFDNLSALDDRGLQRLMREIPQDLLVPALKGTDVAMQNRFFNNMSKRAAEMLRDDLEVSGPIRLSEVEEAHKEILAIARRLSDEGTISLGSKGGDEYV
ncbi:MAG: flagellar motor switch protein FliG [Xanthomonadales bacterium]|nr:flagellar motor switch protein FliG [Xanthomonadales bacterium]